MIDTARKVTGMKYQLKYVTKKSGRSSKLIASSRKSKKILGWEPKHEDVEEIYRSAWNWHQNTSKWIMKNKIGEIIIVYITD